MITGIGIDVVDIARFERQLARTPALLARLFAESEQARPMRSLAARFAAKESLIKALGGRADVNFHDMVIVQDDLGNPDFRLSGELARHLERLGIDRVHLSMSHDAGIASAFVVLEATGAPGGIGQIGATGTGDGHDAPGSDAPNPDSEPTR